MTPLQMSLFQPNFDERIRRVVIDGVMYFSILDVFEHFGSKGSAVNPAIYWKRAKERLEAQKSVTREVITDVLLHKFEGARQKATPITTLNTLRVMFQILNLSKKNEAEYIYLLSYEEDRRFVKIGKAVDLKVRLSSYMGHTSPDRTPIYLYTVKTLDASKLERLLHHRYAKYMRRGEWFELSRAQVEDAITYIAQAVQSQLGISLATGKPLLSAGH